jgi:hypothetical protein
MKHYDISPDEWGWDLLTTELDDDLCKALKDLSMPDGFEEINYNDNDGFRWWFNIAYNIHKDSKWEIGENHYDEVIKLLEDNGYTSKK